jgi:gamma-glutamyltranspeptidase / glutathione hydrolase
VDAVDRWGNMVSATPSGGWLQSSPVIPALGFCLGTRLQMCWLEAGLPASLAPGKRPRTTLSPSFAFRDGTPYLAFGTFYPRAMRPGVVVLEGGFPEATRRELARRGHRLAPGEDWSEGRLSACAREPTPEGMIVKAAANPRGMQGYAIGR